MVQTVVTGSAPLTQDGANLTIDLSAAATTMMACEDPIMNQATAYMAALDSATSFTASAIS
ncbi:MAG: META domain-containing protein [Chloroflexi bacterium]|nr:META domain-containing protein [Chloroflexota bacterium]